MIHCCGATAQTVKVSVMLCVYSLLLFLGQSLGDYRETLTTQDDEMCLCALLIWISGGT